jgi:hypothetical protein
MDHINPLVMVSKFLSTLLSFRKNSLNKKLKFVWFTRGLIMEVPSRLPHHLSFYQSCGDDQELFEKLTHQTEDLLLFFKCACEDEKWTLQHSKWIRLLLRWTTKQFYLGNFPLDHACRLVKIIQHHYSLLEPFLFFRAALFFTVKLRIENEVVLVNSLLFGVGSPVLREILKRECFDKLRDEWVLDGVKMSNFLLIQTYLYQGQIPNLSKYNPLEVKDLMIQAKAWGIEGLVKDCLFVMCILRG